MREACQEHKMRVERTGLTQRFCYSERKQNERSNEGMTLGIITFLALFWVLMREASQRYDIRTGGKLTDSTLLLQWKTEREDKREMTLRIIAFLYILLFMRKPSQGYDIKTGGEKAYPTQLPKWKKTEQFTSCSWCLGWSGEGRGARIWGSWRHAGDIPSLLSGRGENTDSNLMHGTSLLHLLSLNYFPKRRRQFKGAVPMHGYTTWLGEGLVVFFPPSMRD